MRKSFWARLLILTLMFALVPISRPAAAATDSVVQMLSFTYPSSITAGNKVTFTVRAQAATPVGTCCGSLTVKDPQGTTNSVRLSRSGSEFTGVLETSPNAPAGTYVITSMTLTANDNKRTTLDSATGFVHSFVVTSSGQPVDTVGPELVSLNVTAQAEMGDAVTITAKITDDLSGVRKVLAWIEPVAEKPSWKHAIELFPTGQPDEFAGNTLMDALAAKQERVVKVEVRDRAGNTTTVEGEKLTGNKAFVRESSAKMRVVPEGLVTQPYLQVIHPGSLAFWNWFYADWDYAVALFRQSRTDATTVREKIAGELPQLQAAMEAVRREIYVDPATKLKVSPYATSGKWMVLETAMFVRSELLLELERREGKLESERREVTEQVVSGFYDSLIGDEEYWARVDGALNETLSQYPAAVLSVLAQSPEAVQAMKSPANEGVYANFSTFDRDVTYFLPVFSQSSPEMTDGSAAFAIKLNPGLHLHDLVQDLFYEIGVHFGQAYFSHYDDRNRVVKWDAYLKLRNAHEWTEETGHLGEPANNIGDDFAYAFLPLNLNQQYYSLQSYGQLRDNPATVDGFKKLVRDRLAKGAPVVSITPSRYIVTGVNPLKITVNPGAVVRAAEGAGPYYGNASVRKPMNRTTNGQEAIFTGDDATVGRLFFYILGGKDQDGRDIFRFMNYYRVPVALDPVPTAVSKPSVKITGTAPENATVTLNTGSATATATTGSTGRFEAAVPLTVGENSIRVTVSGVQLGARVKVLYEPEGTKVPLKVTLPGSSGNTRVEGTVKTAPFATVTVGAIKGQADSEGEYTLYYTADEGVNKIVVTATSPAGNKATWTGTLIVDSLPPVITVSVPIRTNLPVYKVEGKVDPGSTLTMGDTVIKVALDGAFSVDISLEENKPRELEFAATDAAGNRVSTKATITYSPDAPTVTREANVVIFGELVAGLELTYNGKPVPVNSFGNFRLWAPSPAGRNVYTLTITANGKPAGFLQYVVINPIQVDFPVALEDGTLKLNGKTVPGYIVIVDGRTVTVEADGSWSAVITRNDRKTVEVLAQGDGQTYKETVVLP